MNTTSRRSSARAIEAGIVAGLVAGLVLAYLLRPSYAEVGAAGRSLVPPRAQVSSDVEVTGQPPFAPDHYVHIEFNGGAPFHDSLVREVEKTARQAGWSVIRREEAPGAMILQYRRDGVAARISVRGKAGPVGGVIHVDRHESTHHWHLALFPAMSALVGGTASALFWRTRGEVGESWSVKGDLKEELQRLRAYMNRLSHDPVAVIGIPLGTYSATLFLGLLAAFGAGSLVSILTFASFVLSIVVTPWAVLATVKACARYRHRRRRAPDDRGCAS